jgi:4-aminobutyrate aminotransferase/(S)-3-amino-2-methylpropionate transaminase
MNDPRHLEGQNLEVARAARLPGWGSDTPLILVEGRGALVWDSDGNEYIDCTSQAWSLNIGHSHPKVLEAVAGQMQKLSHARTSFDTYPLLELSTRLVDLTPGDFDKQVSYTLHGSLAIETAMKQALRQHNGYGSFVTLYDAYHGRSFGSMALSWPHPNNAFLGFQGRVVRVPQAYRYRCRFCQSSPRCTLECVEFTEEAIDKAVDGPPVAFVMEPIQGNGGQIDFPARYYTAIREMCSRRGILLIWDEIQTAFGRVGAMTAAELYGVEPDIIVFGKGVGGGFPLAGTIARADLEPLEPGDHGFTFGAFPVSMAAALATIDVLEEENLLERCRMLGQRVTARLRELQSQYELIGDVRGPGLMIGFELVKDRQTKEPAREEARLFVAEGLKRGVIFGESKYAGLGNVVKVKPPLVITDEQVERVLDVIEEVLEAISPSHT